MKVLTKIEQVEQSLELMAHKANRKSINQTVSFQDKLVTVLEVVKPTLEWIQGFIFTPKRWKKAIGKILEVLNAIEQSTTVTFEA